MGGGNPEDQAAIAEKKAGNGVQGLARSREQFVEKGIPEKGIEAGTEFEDLPDDFKCPRCGAGKALFKQL